MSIDNDEERDYALSDVPDPDAEAGARRLAEWRREFSDDLSDVMERRQRAVQSVTTS